MTIKSKYINLIRLLHNEHRSLDELIHIQTLGLRKLVKHSYTTVKLYKKLFDDCGLHPEDIQSLDDITKIPIIDKQTLQQNSYDSLISKAFKIKDLIPIKTAGSNGMPFLFYIDHSFDQFRKAQFLRPYITNGRLPWDNSILFSVHPSPPKKWFQYFGFMRDNYIYSGMDIGNQIQIYKKTKPDVIQGYGSILNLLSNKIIEENIAIPKPKLIFTDSELLMPSMRSNIEKAFQKNVIDIYGTFESDNIAYECSYHNGYHIAIDSVIIEFLNNGKKVNEGEEGEIVITILNNFAMPFIRYNLQDIGTSSFKRCPCGRTFPLITQIKGRANDYMITAEGKKLSFFNVAYFEQLAPNVKEYQIIQESINYFNVYIVPGVDYKNQEEKIITPAIKKFFPDAKINLNIVTKIERESSGKFKAFKSMVHNPHD